MPKITMPKPRLTVGDLRKLIEGKPDNMHIYASVACPAIDQWGNEYWDSKGGFVDRGEAFEDIFLGAEELP